MTEIELALLAGFSFIAAVVSTLTGMGGGIVLLAASTLILPMSAVIPLNCVIILGGQFSRLCHFYRHINWPISGPFILGALLGVLLGTQTFSLMSEFAISLCLSVTIIGILWIPALNLKLRLPWPYAWTGVVHTWLSAVTGLGGLLQGIMLRSSHSRNTIIATIAASMMSMSVLKTLGYAWVGFDYQPYLLAIAVSILAGFSGTWVGKRCLHLITEARFRTVMRWLLTLFALRLFWNSWSLY